ncbi:MAG TPA: PqqD family protein [Edaphobacter sp.]|uniref:PqqD family protein n=1 Tax=Edaphobacter sp. TaxID=1934404 RepID=UPI002D17FAEC|nr:PqqD family protein [Edaphobacter sp.]HUZ96182.1 PqqD family protein [Edaphobacter sp.]
MAAMPAHLRSIVDHDGAVILDIKHNAATPLNSTGAYIWQRLEQGMLVDDIVAQLARETNTEIEIVAADVDRFLEKLKSRHLLTHD